MTLKAVPKNETRSDPHLPAPPADLAATGRELWDKLMTAYRIEDEGGRAVLAVACRAADRAEGCRLKVAKEGMTVRDRWRQVRPHPLLAVERSARDQMLRAIIALSLPLPEEER